MWELWACKSLGRDVMETEEKAQDGAQGRSSNYGVGREEESTERA